MRKIIWFIYARIRIWWIYRTKDNTPFSEGASECRCPICYWDISNDEYCENMIMQKHFYSGYYGNVSWTEVWECPRCRCIFEVDSGN